MDMSTAALAVTPKRRLDDAYEAVWPICDVLKGAGALLARCQGPIAQAVKHVLVRAEAQHDELTSAVDLARTGTRPSDGLQQLLSDARSLDERLRKAIDVADADEHYGDLGTEGESLCSAVTVLGVAIDRLDACMKILGGD